MTIQAETFYEYIIQSNTENTNRFKVLFENDIPKLPNKVTSSVTIRKHLQINNQIKEKAFQAVFLEYFKKKLYNSL
jgi:hypothetical protein